MISELQRTIADQARTIAELQSAELQSQRRHCVLVLPRAEIRRHGGRQEQDVRPHRLHHAPRYRATTSKAAPCPLTTCRKALVAMKDELRAKVQAANDLVEAVREALTASTVGAAAVVALLPSVGSFYSRPKDTCSKCGSSDAQAFSLRAGSTKPVCYRGCSIERRVRDQPEPTPILLSQQYIAGERR